MYSINLVLPKGAEIRVYTTFNKNALSLFGSFVKCVSVFLVECS